MDKKLIIGISVNILVLLIAGIIDLTLQLGKFSGLVFFLYSFYGLGIVFVTYLFLGFFKDKVYFRYSLFSLITAFLLFIINQLV